eukprot:scaffold10563_cov147-Skeletonema_marinoi.AAC.1
MLRSNTLLVQLLSSVQHQIKIGRIDLHIEQPSPRLLFETSNILARNPDISTNEYFHSRLEINNIGHIRFMPFKDRVFSVNVPSEVFCGKIITSHNGVSLTGAEFCGVFRNRGDWFKTTIQEAPNFPHHVLLRVINSVFTKLGSGGVGKRAKHPFIMKFYGGCSVGHNCKLNGETCSTKWVGGMDYDNLLKLAMNPMGSTIVVSIQISGQCVHQENMKYGRLMGKARKEVVNELRKSNESPKKFVVNKLFSTTSDQHSTYNKQLACNNHSNVVVSPEQVYELKREAKAQNAFEKGIFGTGQDIANVMRVVAQTNAKDLALRVQIGDTSTVIPGQLSNAGRLVMGIDATGGLLNVRNTSSDGKIQHCYLNIQCSECILTNAASKQNGRRVLSPATVSEKIAAVMKTENIADWLTRVSDDVVIAMNSVVGRGTGHPL